MRWSKAFSITVEDTEAYFKQSLRERSPREFFLFSGDSEDLWAEQGEDWGISRFTEQIV